MCRTFLLGLQLLTLTSVGIAVVLYRRKRNVKAMMMAFLNSQFFIVVEVRPQMQSRGPARSRRVGLADLLGGLGPTWQHPPPAPHPHTLLYPPHRAR